MEHKSGQRRRFKKVLLICALGVGALLLPVVAWWAVGYCRVEVAIRAFASNPSQAGANKLTGLLDNYSPTRGQATRILRLLLQPKVNTRRAYPVGRKPSISTTIPCYLHLPTGMKCRVDVRADGQIRSISYSSVQFGTEPDVWVCPVVPDRPGKLRMEVQYQYLLRPPSASAFYFENPLGRFLRGLLARMKIQPWLPPPENKWYQVRFQVPVEIDVVEAAQAEQVQLLSNPELDSRMRDLLRPEVWFNTPGRPGGLCWWGRGQVLPVDVAFRCFLELPDGTRVMPHRPELRRLRGYAGWDFAVSQPLAKVVPLPPGMHEVKFVFETDPNYALDEPTMKSIWNGRLEFPIRFTVPPEPNTGR
jgi:hypothetical protein